MGLFNRIILGHRIDDWASEYSLVAARTLNQVAADLLASAEQDISSASLKDGLLSQSAFLQNRIAPKVREVAEPVMAQLVGGSIRLRSTSQAKKGPSEVTIRDEHYVLDLCDVVLGQKAVRQHCFEFLTGDPDRRGYRKPLPVDGFYPALGLVVEYHERQHRERVGFFDDKPTVSGIPRGEQRRRYDQRRADLLPRHGYSLVVLEVDEFAYDRAKRLVRTPEDQEVISRRLSSFIG